MDLHKTVETNLKIIALIQSKYTDPSCVWPNTIEHRYFDRLQADTYHARQALQAGGLASPTVNP